MSDSRTSIRLWPLAPSVLVSLLLSGCYDNQMVVDRAWIVADLPVPPPAFVPDSSRIKDGFVQAGLQLSEGRTFEPGNNKRWDVAPLSAQLQLQQMLTPRIRLVLGGCYSNSASAWVGSAMSVAGSNPRWDLEFLLGGTWATGQIVGHQEDALKLGESSESIPDSIFVDEPRGWGQAALRARMIRSGPWMELRLLPWFLWGTLEGTPDKTTQNASVVSSIAVLGGGWIQEFRGGSSVILGVRTAFVDDEGVQPHFVIGVQKRLSRLSP